MQLFNGDRHIVQCLALLKLDLCDPGVWRFMQPLLVNNRVLTAYGVRKWSDQLNSRSDYFKRKTCFQKIFDTTFSFREGQWGHGVKKVIWPFFSPFQTILRRFFCQYFLKMLLLNFVQICYVDSSKFLDGCVKIVTWISRNCYMDLSKLTQRFL